VRHAESSGVPTAVVTYRAGQDAFNATYSFCGAESTRNASRPQDLVDPAALGDGATVVYNDLVGWPRPLAAVAFLRSLAERKDVHARVLIHDFYPVCPSYTLLDDSNRFCGVPADLADCRRCLPGNPHAHLQADPGQWRSDWGGLLEVADEVICFSASSREILIRAYPALANRVLVRPHEPVTTIERSARVMAGRPLTVGVIGGINVAKGARVVMDLCEHLRSAAPAARVVVIGEVDPAEQRRFPNLTIHGRYAAANLTTLVEHHGVNACLLPSIWPETFSYVTQEIMSLELPLVCFDVGAPPERVRDYPYGVVIEHGNAAAVHRALEQARQRREAVSPAGAPGG
jgi:glycosyltransferase involved in cell wall biosynthesis